MNPEELRPKLKNCSTEGRLAPAAGNSSPSRPSDENIASVNKPRVRVISPPIPADMCKHTCEDDGCPKLLKTYRCAPVKYSRKLYGKNVVVSNCAKIGMYG
jgi:hypothetical protein